MAMTIQAFSTKTGLPPSTLRYYDRQNLLVPAKRLENGYRVYTEDQVEDALMIHSLRQADISMKEIRQFLSAAKNEKSKWISKWRKEVETKLSALKIARQYLGGIHPENRGIHLVKWDMPTTMLWFHHEIPRNPCPFVEAAESDRLVIENMGIDVKPGVYIQTLDAGKQTMTGKVGFCLKNGVQTLPDHQDYDMEIREPTLFVSFECTTANDFLCFNLMQLLRKYGFEINGAKMEKYNDIRDNTYQLLIPVMQTLSS